MAQLFLHSSLLALQATLSIARFGSYDSPVKSQTIEHQFGLNPRALEAILRKLAHQGILQAKSGATGGYYVSNKHTITLDQVIAPFLTLPKDADLIEIELANLLLPALNQASASFFEALANLTLESLCERFPSEPSATVLNFEI